MKAHELAKELLDKADVDVEVSMDIMHDDVTHRNFGNVCEAIEVLDEWRVPVRVVLTSEMTEKNYDEGVPLSTAKELAKLKWERRILLNKLKDAPDAVGAYGKNDPFSKSILSYEESVELERKLRQEYLDVGGDISEWYVNELEHYICVYGYFVYRVSSTRYEIYKLKTSVPSESNDCDPNVRRIIVAYIDMSGLPNDKYYLICAKGTIDDKIMEFDENFLIVREQIFLFDKA